MAQSTAPAVAVEAEGCDPDVPIQAAIGQSFTLPGDGGLALDGISVWIDPAAEDDTSYELVLQRGEGPLGALMATSATVEVGSRRSGARADWQDFAFNTQSLEPDRPYTWVLVSRQAVSGTVALCDERYADGFPYRPGVGGVGGIGIGDLAFRVHGAVLDPPERIALGDLGLLNEPGVPANTLPPEIADLAARGLLGARKSVMPLGDSITDMPANLQPFNWGGPFWGGYRKQMTDHVFFKDFYQFVGSYGVDEYALTPSPWTMPWDQRWHCGWSGASMDGWSLPGSSIIENFWKCNAVVKNFGHAQLDYVLMHAGTNDLRNQREDPAAMGNRVAERGIALIEAALWSTKATFIVSTLIPQTGESAKFNPNVIAYNKALKEKIADRQAAPNTAWYWGTRVKQVDMYEAFHKYTNDRPNEALLDGLHPNERGSEIMAFVWQNAILNNDLRVVGKE